VTAPLHDVHVCDLTQNLAGPYCTQILADLGARVVKVEPPGGDLARAWGPPFWGSRSALFLSANRGKRSIVVDLKDPRGMEVLSRIVRRSDVFVQASRPGVSRRLGFDYAAIRAVREDIVYMGISAYGKRGPLSELPGYDPLMQAYSGIMSVTGHPGVPPTRVGGAVIDYGTGMWAAMAILAALRTRDATGEGAELETSLLDTALGWVSYHVAGYLGTGQVPGPMGSGLAAIAPYQAFPTSDGNVMIAAGNDVLFRRLCAALELDELATDERFTTNPSRVEHRDELTAILEERTRLLSTSELLALGRQHEVPCSAIHSIGDVVDDEQVAAAEMIPAAPNPELPHYREVALPLRMGGARPRARESPPAAGEHTVEILEGLGLNRDEIEALVESGAVSASTAADRATS
jgi:crotonobetainyl-CoA:carnitine CoA-transferase CaiB-like acyl-CoA transferase